MLKDILMSYNKKVYPMHMPGHKGGRFRLLKDPYAVDVTEVPGTDHLYNAVDVLKDSMERLSAFYKTKKSTYLINGSTVGILSAIGGLCRKKDKILIARNCHHSVYHAVELFELEPIYVYPKMTQWGMIGGVDPRDVSKALTANPEIVTFVMTSPTFDGFISDVQGIKNLCDRYNVTLVVDEAHGAHLPYCDAFPTSALDSKAGVVIHSMHKTMPVITGGALMHLNLPDDLENSVLKMLSKLQTSSPSYIMMANMDCCVATLGQNQVKWLELIHRIDAMNLKLKKMKKLFALTDYINEEEAIVATDPLKSILITRNTLKNGVALEMELRKLHKIQLELSDDHHALGILSIADSHKALQRYAHALRRLDRQWKGVKILKDTQHEMIVAKRSMLPHQVNMYDSEWVPIQEAVDRIAATMITPYPPGIPLVVGGEILEAGVVGSIQQSFRLGSQVLGVKEGKILVIKD